MDQTRNLGECVISLTFLFRWVMVEKFMGAPVVTPKKTQTY